MTKGTPGSQRPRGFIRALLDLLDDHISAPIAARARARGWHVLPVPGTRDVVYRHPGFPRRPCEGCEGCERCEGCEGCEGECGRCDGDADVGVDEPSAAGALR